MDADETTRALLRSYGERTAPSSAQRERAWQTLDASVRATPPATGIGAAGKVLGGLVVLAAAALWLTSRSAPTPPTPMPPHPTVIDAVPTEPPREPLPIEASEPPTSSTLPAAHRPRAAAPAPTTEIAPAEPSLAPSEDTLAEELALMNTARAAVAQGDPTRALEALDRHAARFPHGALASERDVVRVSALCAAGQSAEAHAVAEAAGDRPAIARALSRCTAR